MPEVRHNRVFEVRAFDVRVFDVRNFEVRNFEVRVFDVRGFDDRVFAAVIFAVRCMCIVADHMDPIWSFVWCCADIAELETAAALN